MKCLNELQIRGQAFRDDWYEVEPIVLWRFFSQTCNLPPNPHILTSHRSTAELRVVGIENSRTESLTEEPSPWSNDLAMSHLRIRETNVSPCVGLAHYLKVCTRKKGTAVVYCCTQQHCCKSPRVLGSHWAHTLGHLEIDNPPR